MKGVTWKTKHLLQTRTGLLWPYCGRGTLFDEQRLQKIYKQNQTMTSLSQAYTVTLLQSQEYEAKRLKIICLFNDAHLVSYDV